MKIGIIGAGALGLTLAKLFERNGHSSMISNSRGPDSLQEQTAEIGCLAGETAEAARFGEIVVVAIPFFAYSSLPAERLADKIVIDANNYYPTRDGRIEALDKRQTTTSELIAVHLYRSQVVKAFNAIMASDILADSRPAGAADRRALPIAGDFVDPKRCVAQLMDELGFDVVDAGSLAESWRFERAKPAYCIPLSATDLRRALSDADRNYDLPEGSWRRKRDAAIGEKNGESA